MAVNKVVLRNNRTLIDLTSDTVSTSTLLKGYTAHSKNGAVITGTLDLTTLTWNQLRQLTPNAANQSSS